MTTTEYFGLPCAGKSTLAESTREGRTVRLRKELRDRTRGRLISDRQGEGEETTVQRGSDAHMERGIQGKEMAKRGAMVDVKKLSAIVQLYSAVLGNDVGVMEDLRRVRGVDADIWRHRVNSLWECALVEAEINVTDQEVILDEGILQRALATRALLCMWGLRSPSEKVHGLNLYEGLAWRRFVFVDIAPEIALERYSRRGGIPFLNEIEDPRRWFVLLDRLMRQSCEDLSREVEIVVVGG